MEPRIGILTREDDIHGPFVKKKIEEQHGIWCCLIASDRLAGRGGLTWASQEAEAWLPTHDGTLVDVGTLNALWCRRPPTKQTLPAETDPEFAGHIDFATEMATYGILLDRFRGRWVNDPVAMGSALNKIVQLRAAQHAGFRIPVTLVSQDPARIRSFCAAHPGAIIKPVAARRGSELAPTAVVSRELLDRDDVLAVASAIYQECIPGERHLRISVLGERCDAALIESKALDWRLDVNVPFRPYPLDPSLERRLCTTLEQLGLVMGIFDLKLTDDDEPVFLEVNPQGQFLFVEGLCDLPLADGLAAFLVDQAMQDFRSRDRNAATPVYRRQSGQSPAHQRKIEHDQDRHHS
jgi:hypothetical protein